MILETCQMLVTARVLRGDLPQGTKYHTYRMRNHPCAKWVREDRAGFLYAERLLAALCAEFTFRWDKTHATETFYRSLPPTDMRRMFPHRRRRKAVPEAVGDHPRSADPVATYRSYYGTKNWELKWTKREQPEWYLRHDTSR